MTNTLEKLREIVARDYKIAPALLTSESLLEELGVDSLGVAELLFNIEDEFNINVPPEPVTLVTLGDVVTYIDALVVAQSIEAPQQSNSLSASA